jgi:serine/threonine-protein kinase HipA
MVSFRRPRTDPLDRTLGVWINGEHVGRWSVMQGEHHFQYDAHWLSSAASRPLSLSLPFTPGNVPHRGAVVRDYFDNLLPDSMAIRRRLATRFSADADEPFALLGAIGRDCVGAIQLLPDNARPEDVHRIDAEPLDEAGVARIIDGALAPAPLADGPQRDDLRISIAGAQEKTALLWHKGRWCRPLGATPTTHILKLPLGLVGNMRADMSTSVENEWLCAQVLDRLGLPVAHCDMARFGRHKVLVVERFDRMLSTRQGNADWWLRLPQEDFCQALGVSGLRKYEADGGPGIPAILRQLGGSSRSEPDKQTFLKALFAFWLMAATDGHAKNFSIFLERGGGFRLTPLYDVLSVWPIIGNGPNQLPYRRAKLAMAIRSKNTHYHLHEIQTRHWVELARRSGVPEVFDQFVALALLVPHAMDTLKDQLPKDFPAQRVFDPIRAGMIRQAERFIDGLT